MFFLKIYFQVSIHGLEQSFPAPRLKFMESTVLTITLTSPPQVGDFVTKWRLSTPDSLFFGGNFIYFIPKVSLFINFLFEILRNHRMLSECLRNWNIITYSTIKPTSYVQYSNCITPTSSSVFQSLSSCRR